MAPVIIRNLEKHYGALKVLKDVTLEIADGEFVVLVGPSGCGKSTLLRSIAGLEDITSGELRIGDRLVNDLPAKDRDIAMVFQSYALYPHMTVEQNMSFALRLKRTQQSLVDERVSRAADILGLRPLMERYPRQLSGGQRQRVAMGRAIVRDPKAFLFDEPLSNLDANLRVQMRTEIKELHQRLGTTMIYVTHDQVEAMTMADRIVVMRDGIIEQVGTPLELYDRPVNAFVAEFIGSPSMNLLHGQASADTFTTRDGIALPGASGMTAAATTYGIRPEHIHLAAQGTPAQVVVVEPTGSETHIIVRLGGQSVSVLVRERIDLSPGANVHLAPDVRQVHAFDQDGMRLN